MTDSINKVITILREKFSISTPMDGATRLNDLGIDSLDVINFLYSLEEETGVKIPDEAIEAEGLETLGDFARYVDTHR